MLEKSAKILGKLRQAFSSGEELDDLCFNSAGFLTLGVEIELQLINPATYNLVPRADELLMAGQHLKKLKPEFYLSTVEINTDKCTDVHCVERDLWQTMDALQELASSLDLQFATTGCHPFSRYADCVITPSARYAELIDRNQWLTRRMTVYGLHVHVGMASGDDCIRFSNFFLHFLPHLLALSASSPYWQGEDTGLASCRPSTYEAMPTAGQPYPVRNWRDFETLYHALKKCRAIDSLKDMWWDLRPSPNFGTLEIRVCDGPATLAEATAITAYIHLLAHWFQDNGSWIDQVPQPSAWLMRENKWRVMRHGLSADIVVSLEGDTRPVSQHIEEWLEKLQTHAQALGYLRHVDTLREILARGNSTARQRQVFERYGTLEQVVAFNVREFNARSPLWDAALS
jgi:carboxylate-amine ligase